MYSFSVRHENLGSAFQVKGHLDYMRQMDTILVAVGVPTKEVPGASFALHQPATTDHHDRIPKDPETQNSAETHTEGSETLAETGNTGETGDGWDIPDISDLLDSLNDTESENSPLTSEDPPAKNNLASGCDGEEEEPGEEHGSWSWDETVWTPEQQQNQPDS